MKTILWGLALSEAGLWIAMSDARAENASPPPSVTVPKEHRHPDEGYRGDARIQENRSRYNDPLRLGPYPGNHMNNNDVPENSVVVPKNWTTAQPEPSPGPGLKISNITTVPKEE